MHKYYKSLVLIMALCFISFINIHEKHHLVAMLDCSPHSILANEVVTLDHYQKDDGYYTFLPADARPENVKTVVMLVHGYGALNPAIFGAWIQHLLDNGNIVVYPRYQKNLLIPGAQKFTGNAMQAWKNAVSELEAMGYQDYKVIFTGHSFGGVIISNLVADGEEMEIKMPDAVLVCEGGVGPFTGAIREDYEGVSDKIPFVMIVGERDWTVGATFANKLFKDLPHHAETHYIFQKMVKLSDGRMITASHYEPYSMDDWCDNGMHNFTYKRALQVAKLDELNHSGYWYWLDLLIKRVNHPDKVKITETLLRKNLREALPHAADSILDIVVK